VINPGSTSVKLGYCSAAGVQEATEIGYGDDLVSLVVHQKSEAYLERLRQIVHGYLAEQEANSGQINAIAARGGLLKPVAGGVVEIDQKMVDDLQSCCYGWHPSNMAAVIAWEIAGQRHIPAYIVDPISTDDLEPAARLSGYPGIQRRSFSHALNMKQMGRQVAERELGKAYQQCGLIVVHMGGRVSVSAQRGGKMIDVNDGRGEGPFGIEGCGTLPVYELLKFMTERGISAGDMWKQLRAGGGLYGYLGTRDFRRVEACYGEDEQTTLVVDALGYQIAKEVGACAAVLEGRVDGIVLTGGPAHSTLLVDKIKKMIGWIAPVFVRPGESEMDALAVGALEALTGACRVGKYADDETCREFPA
jgi:butyrate kinase